MPIYETNGTFFSLLHGVKMFSKCHLPKGSVTKILHSLLISTNASQHTLIDIIMLTTSAMYTSHSP